MSRCRRILYFHVCALKDWQERFQSTMDLVIRSGLYDCLDQVLIGFLGPHQWIGGDWFRKYDKAKLRAYSQDKRWYERLTLHAMQKDSQSAYEKDVYLYLHTKGVTKTGHVGIQDWIDMMLYFLVEQHESTVSRLLEPGIDAVGCNFQPDVPHFSGNFWWARASHIQRLPPKIQGEYLDPEFWILQRKSWCVVCLYHSHTVHDLDRHPRSRYESSPSQEYQIKLG